MERKMKVAVFFTYGISLRTWDDIGMLSREISIYRRLADRIGFIYFLTYGQDDKKFQDLLPPNMKILPKKFRVSNWLYSLLLPIAYRKELTGCDWFKTNQVWGAWSAVLSKIIYRKALYVRQGYQLTIHARRGGAPWYENSINQITEFISYQASDCISVSAETQIEYICSKYQTKKNKLFYLPNCVDTQLFHPADKSQENRLSVIVTVSSLCHRKNIMNLAIAMKEIPNVELWLVGTGPLEKQIQELIQKETQNVVLWGNIPNNELPNLLTEADIFILPSLYEGHPKAVLEAMACGIPVIATNVPGLRDLIQHQITGYLCGTSVAEIADAIRTVLSDRILRRKMGEHGRRYAEDHFSMARCIDLEVKMLNHMYGRI